MKKIYLMVFVFFLLAIGLYGEENFEGELVEDIDHDGKVEMVQWNWFINTELGSFYQLRVIDDDGSLLWVGPKSTKPDNPYIFAALDYGNSIPELLADIDNDGYVELLAPEYQSDVSPTTYRILRWRDRQFDLLPSAALMAKKSDINHFFWTDDTGKSAIWISEFTPDPLDKYGEVKVSVIRYDEGGTAEKGIALIRFNPSGAEVVRWLKPLKNHPIYKKCSSYVVTVNQLNVRDRPEKPSNILGSVHRGDRVCVYDFSGKWGRTDQGWISGKYLVSPKAYTNSEQSIQKTGTVYGLDPHGDGFLSIRKKPNSTEIGRLYNGDKVEILDRRGKWYKIKDIRSGKVGWSHSNWIAVNY